MKLLHTSDWHLGKQLDRYSRFDEQILVLEEICEIAEVEAVDAVIIAGDLFDTFNPPTEAIDLLYRTLKRLSHNGRRAVIALAGNHDSPDRIEAPHPLARECGIFFMGYPRTLLAPITLDSGLTLTRSAPGFIELCWPSLYNYPLRLILTPYANEERLRISLQQEDTESEVFELIQRHWASLATRFCDSTGVNVLVHHLFMCDRGGEVPEESEGEKSILHVGGLKALFTESIPPEIQYVAMGHIHRPTMISSLPIPIVYSGSPLAYSFGEANQIKSVSIVEIEPGKKAFWQQKKLTKGRPLCRKRFVAIDEAIVWLQENPTVLVELTILSDSYLSSAEIMKLREVHKGIVMIIPEIKNPHQEDLPFQNKILSHRHKSLEENFKDYFKFKKGGQEPSEEILSLLQEVVSSEEKS